jgi:hypothetical protein
MEGIAYLPSPSHFLNGTILVLVNHTTAESGLPFRCVSSVLVDLPPKQTKSSPNHVFWGKGELTVPP